MRPATKKQESATGERLPTAHCSPPTGYVELHARSAFSFLEGASVPEELIAACQALQMPAMALLDRDGVYGAPRFHLAAEKNGLKAHIGAEITVRLDEGCASSSRFALMRAGRPRSQWAVAAIPVLVRNR